MTTAVVAPRLCVVLTGARSGEDPVEQEIIAMIVSAGFAARRADQTLAPGVVVVDAVLENIRQADVVVALVHEPDSAWLWFEVGAAVALGRPVVVVTTSAEIMLPPDLTGLLTVGPIVSPEAITLVLQRALKSPARLQTTPVEPTGVPLGDRAAELLARLQDLGLSGNDGAQFDSWFASVLASARVPFDQGAQSDPQLPGAFQRIDFVVTANELEGNLGNPLPVELKVRGSLDAFIRSRRQVFASYLLATGARTLLLVAISEVDEPQFLPLPGGGSLLTCNVRDLLQRMSRETFGQAVIGMRNQAIHGLRPP